MWNQSWRPESNYLISLLWVPYTAIPALKPVVYDLFLLRGTVKSEVGKDLETQREVVVSMLLRLVQYHQVSLFFFRDDVKFWLLPLLKHFNTIILRLCSLFVNYQKILLCSSFLFIYLFIFFFYTETILKYENHFFTGFGYVCAGAAAMPSWEWGTMETTVSSSHGCGAACNVQATGEIQ